MTGREIPASFLRGGKAAEKGGGKRGGRRERGAGKGGGKGAERGHSTFSSCEDVVG